MSNDVSVIDSFIELLINTRHSAVSIRNNAQLTGDLDSASDELSKLFTKLDEDFYDIQHDFRSADIESRLLKDNEPY